MSANTATDVAKLLEFGGFGTTASPAPTIFSNNMPQLPHELIAVNASPGLESEDTFGGTVQEVENITVLVRRDDSNSAAVDAKAVRVFLHRKKGTFVGVPYISIWARSMPFPIGRDENNRWLWSCNYIVRKTPV